MFNEDSSHSGDSYSKYALNPANKHDDSKLQEKYSGTNLGGGGATPTGAAQAPPIGGSAPPKNDPYRFTRSTLQKQQSTPNIDKARMADLTSRYRYTAYTSVCNHLIFYDTYVTRTVLGFCQVLLQHQLHVLLFSFKCNSHKVCI